MLLTVDLYHLDEIINKQLIQLLRNLLGDHHGHYVIYYMPAKQYVFVKVVVIIYYCLVF